MVIIILDYADLDIIPSKVAKFLKYEPSYSNKSKSSNYFH